LRWLAYGYTVYSLLDEVGISSQRISEIVKAVKSYSYLDQAPVQEVNVVDGLENTLIILKHKLKQGVNIVREYDPDLPRIEAYASELNQIWTNIIDNSIDAMNGQGEIVLKTYRQTGHVVVEICDTGPGIPAEIQARIFEPFFTTKAPGIGTGLGLNIAYNIVQKHRGLIKVNSQPGQTCFQVTLPIRLK
jgi:signal transduction histidine kinase